MEIEADLILSIEYSKFLNSILPDHEKYIQCFLDNNKFKCTVKGKINDVRKTINEFLESLEFIEKFDKF